MLEALIRFRIALQFDNKGVNTCSLVELFNTANVYENDETMEIDVSSSRVRDRLARKLLL